MPKLAERAREEESWSHERFLEAVLSTEVASRESHGGEGRIKAARFPARKTLEEFDFTFQRSVQKQVIEHLGQLDFLQRPRERRHAGPAGDRQDAPGDRARDPCLPRRPAGSPSRPRPSGSRASARQSARASFEAELARLGRIPLLIVDEVGYIPFDPEAANLMFSLVSARYERASLIVTSNKAFSAWGEIFGDEVTAAAMIDRLVHHAEILGAQGRQLPASRQGPRLAAAPRLIAPPAPLRPTGSAPQAGYRASRGGSTFNRRKGVSFRECMSARYLAYLDALYQNKIVEAHRRTCQRR